MLSWLHWMHSVFLTPLCYRILLRTCPNSIRHEDQAGIISTGFVLRYSAWLFSTALPSSFAVTVTLLPLPKSKLSVLFHIIVSARISPLKDTSALSPIVTLPPLLPADPGKLIPYPMLPSAVTLPPVIEISPKERLFISSTTAPQPIAAPATATEDTDILTAVAVTEPPDIVMLSTRLFCPPPMAAAPA